jgi:hypothetical protein
VTPIQIRAINQLTRAGITVVEAQSLSDEILLAVPNFGVGSLAAVRELEPDRIAIAEVLPQIGELASQLEAISLRLSAIAKYLGADIADLSNYLVKEH